MADLNWSIEKIVDCKDNDITTGGWVTISPMQGVGNTHASISVQPSEKYNDCETATITISTGTGEKKYVTINRCNPQCNCGSIENFTPLEVSPIGEDGGTVPVATYSMNYGCTDAYMNIINVGAGCDYNVQNGTVYAVVGKNQSTTTGRDFEYYVTYNGEKCVGNEFKGTFSQNRSVDKCELQNCDSITFSPENVYVSYLGETITITIGASDCWEVREQHDSFGGTIESVTFNSEQTQSYIIIGKNNNDDEREGIVKYFFTNLITGVECEKWVTFTQYGNPAPPVECDNCDVVNAGSLSVNNPIPYAYTDGGTKTLASFTVDSSCPSLSFWFAANPGSIIDQNKANKIFAYQSGNRVTVLANYTPNGGASSIINDNQSTTERTQEILCGVKGSSYPCLTIKLTQSGKPDTPKPVECECVISNFDYSVNVDAAGKPTIKIYNLTDNGLCTSPNGAYIKYTFTGSYEGTTMVGCTYASLKTNAGLTIDVKNRNNPIVLAQGELITGTLSVYLSGCERSTKSFDNVTIGEQGCSINVSCDYSNGGTFKGGLRYEVYGSGTEPITSYTLTNAQRIDTGIAIQIPEEHRSETFTVKAKPTDSRYGGGNPWKFDDYTGAVCGDNATIHMYKNVPINVKACIKEVGGQITCSPTDYQVLYPHTFKMNITVNSDSDTRKVIHCLIHFNMQIIECNQRSPHATDDTRTYYKFDYQQGTLTANNSQVGLNDTDLWVLSNGSKISRISNFRVDDCETIEEHTKYYNRDTHEYYTIIFTEDVAQDCK